MFRVRLFFPSLSHVLVRDLVAVWVWNLDRWLSLQTFWESRSGTAEERPDTESTALDGAEAAKSPTSATSAKHLDIFSSFFHMISHVLASTVFYVFILNLVEHSLQCLSTGFSSTCGPSGVNACWSLKVWCFVFVANFGSLGLGLQRKGLIRKAPPLMEQKLQSLQQVQQAPSILTHDFACLSLYCFHLFSMFLFWIWLNIPCAAVFINSFFFHM